LSSVYRMGAPGRGGREEREGRGEAEAEVGERGELPCIFATMFACASMTDSESGRGRGRGRCRWVNKGVLRIDASTESS
jgi:hypothetical protein